jgi:hypothetical protein
VTPFDSPGSRFGALKAEQAHALVAGCFGQVQLGTSAGAVDGVSHE